MWLPPSRSAAFGCFGRGDATVVIRRHPAKPGADAVPKANSSYKSPLRLSRSEIAQQEQQSPPTQPQEPLDSSAAAMWAKAADLALRDASPSTQAEAAAAAAATSSAAATTIARQVSERLSRTDAMDGELYLPLPPISGLAFTAQDEIMGTVRHKPCKVVPL
ncbi:hypothetical protein PLESTB_000733000 [Pleodorina starrii]|uniref:Uncharacterized protein n=1 Tax=Pleodorina starrii TaxID=330485 RepID=A0A9W6BKN9_9CHLO|nr:hypothetical protein PLESTB_000733000 [Pleodorina starrii]GLC67198.1 hypothetical protein PLESTF_000528200 [Pleodorina starrii]